MTNAQKSAFAVTIALGALALTAPAASAMPRDFAPRLASPQIDMVRWVCGPYRCHWVPNYQHHRHHRHHGFGRW